jgi:hypothetical protein
MVWFGLRSYLPPPTLPLPSLVPPPPSGNSPPPPMAFPTPTHVSATLTGTLPAVGMEEKRWLGDLDSPLSSSSTGSAAVQQAFVPPRRRRRRHHVAASPLLHSASPSRQPHRRFAAASPVAT